MRKIEKQMDKRGCLHVNSLHYVAMFVCTVFSHGLHLINIVWLIFLLNSLQTLSFAQMCIWELKASKWSQTRDQKPIYL